MCHKRHFGDMTRIPPQQPRPEDRLDKPTRAGRRTYSITSSAATCNDVGTVICNRLAVLRFKMNSNLVG